MDARKLLRQHQRARRRRGVLIAVVVAAAVVWGLTWNAATWQRIGSGIGRVATAGVSWATREATLRLGLTVRDQQATQVAVAGPVTSRIDIGNGRQRTVRWAAEDVQCLALAIYHEAGQEERATQLGVAQVVLNRLKPASVGKAQTPRKICSVVYNGLNMPLGCLFRRTCRRIGSIPQPGPSWTAAVETANEVLSQGSTASAPLVRATHFHAVGEEPPGWARGLMKIERIGGLIFLTDAPTPEMLANAARTAPPPVDLAARPLDTGLRPQRGSAGFAKSAPQKPERSAVDLSSVFDR